MKKSIKSAGLVFLFSVFFSGCIMQEETENTPMGNFEALWKIIDERYCFFEYKEVDWNHVYQEYKREITSDMDDFGLFSTLSDMLNELRDGHVNLFNSEYSASSYIWYNDYPTNFNEYIIEKEYLKYNYRVTNGVKYQVMDNNIGYMYVEDFGNDIGTRNLNFIMQFMENCDGIIVDVRNNGGGSISNATRLAARFTDKKVHTGYIRHKTGKGHNDFSSPQAIYLYPSGEISWNKKVAVLTNRQTYSAANEFVNIMSNLPNATIVGGLTGGGSGLPFYSELPNGWAVRFSTSPMFNVNMEQIESGIEPDIPVDITEEDEQKERDTIIEAAIHLLLR